MLSLLNSCGDRLFASKAFYDNVIQRAAKTIVSSGRFCIQALTSGPFHRWAIPTFVPMLVTTVAAILWRCTPISQWVTGYRLSLTPISNDRNVLAMAASDEASSYVSAVGKELMRAVNRSRQVLPLSLNWKFHTIRNTCLGIWALPGGEIIVSDALLSVLDSQELCVLMACAVGDTINRPARQMAIEASSGWDSIYWCCMGLGLGLAFPSPEKSYDVIFLTTLSYWGVFWWGDGVLRRAHDQSSVEFARQLIADGTNGFSQYALVEVMQKLDRQNAEGQRVSKSSPVERWIKVVIGERHSDLSSLDELLLTRFPRVG